jgi:iron-sulfur cluster assembly accessory protein
MSLSDKFDAVEDTSVPLSELYASRLGDGSADEWNRVFGDDGAKVVMDEPSLELLKGSKIDYTMELIGSQFKIVDNPKATSSCGCGTSFDIKM